MSWLKPRLRDSLYGLLGNPPRPSDSVLGNGADEIRECMLDALGDEAPRQFASLVRRVRYADDIQALWYLRGDVMAALASMHGERAARQQIASISAQFQGLLPGGLATRASPLVG